MENGTNQTHSDSSKLQALPDDHRVIWDSRVQRRSAKFWATIGIIGTIICLVTVILLLVIWWPLLAIFYSFRVWQRPEYVLSEDGVYVIKNSGETRYYPWSDVHQLQAARELYERYLLRCGHIFFSTGEMRKGHLVIGVDNPDQVVRGISEKAIFEEN